jgi:NAD+ synthase
MRNPIPSNWPQTALSTNPEEAINDIIRFIQDRFTALNRRIAVVGLSGGLDSTLTASVTILALGKECVQLYYLPDRDSKTIHGQHAKLFADQNNLFLHQLNISSALRAIKAYKLLPLRFFPTWELKARAVRYGRERFFLVTQGEILSSRLSGSGGPWLARANAYISSKHRMRMIALYLEAERQNGMVVGAANRTEWMTGTFTHWGCDHCADVMPLLHLYRSQLLLLAEHLNLPEQIRSKKADPDVLPGLDDKGELLGSFEIADLILWALENDIPREEIVAEFNEEQVSKIESLVEESSFYRDTPYTLL